MPFYTLLTIFITIRSRVMHILSFWNIFVSVFYKCMFLHMVRHMHGTSTSGKESNKQSAIIKPRPALRIVEQFFPRDPITLLTYTMLRI